MSNNNKNFQETSKVIQHPAEIQSYYKYIKLYPDAGTSVTLMANQTNQTQIQISSDIIHNPYNAYLCFERPAIPLLAANYRCIKKTYFPYIIDSQLTLANNIVLYDLKNVDKYTKMAGGLETTKLSDYYNGYLTKSNRVSVSRGATGLPNDVNIIAYDQNSDIPLSCNMLDKSFSERGALEQALPARVIKIRLGKIFLNTL